MADLPPLTYGRVKGRFVAGVADSSDSGLAPDVEPLVGTVTFRLSAPEIRVNDAEPDPTTLYPQPITVPLDDEGYIVHNFTNRLIPLLATNDPRMNPTNLQWWVSFDLQTLGGEYVERESWPFYLPAGTIVDLTVAAPLVNPAPNTIIIKGDKGDPGPNSVPTLEFMTAQVEDVNSPFHISLVEFLGRGFRLYSTYSAMVAAVASGELEDGDLVRIEDFGA